MTEELVKETFIDERTLIIEPRRELTYLSSGIFGGYVKKRGIIIRTVDPDFHEPNIQDWCIKNVLERVMKRDYIVLLTAVNVKERIRIDDTVEDGHNVTLIATVGFSPVACIERKIIYRPLIGTINIIVLTDAKITPQGLADLYRTATEAKTIAVADTLLSCESRPIGTLTDTITVGAEVCDKGYLTCGVATTIGNKVAKMIYKVIIRRYLEYFEDYIARISIKDLIDEIMISELRYRKHIVEKVLAKDDEHSQSQRSL
ncbi:MAG: adenosylcobinamide amidohydrolase [Crenarchaeota archaeon]|nr:adenosylcobinamide amidohydrolase [Thermoproteota archaeon]